MPAIRDNLKTLRINSGLSQNEVAKAIHVTRQTISSYETGRTEPDMETLKQLAELYNADIHDVLYGGNRTQRRIRYLRRAVLGVSAVLLLSLLVRSALLLVNNTWFAMKDGFSAANENISLVEMRFMLRNAGDTIAEIGTSIFFIGCLGLLYPLITMRNLYSFKRFVLWILGLPLSILIVTVPFMLGDEIYGYADYLLPALNALPGMALLFLILIVQVCLRRKSCSQLPGKIKK